MITTPCQSTWRRCVRVPVQQRFTKAPRTCCPVSQDSWRAAAAGGHSVCPGCGEANAPAPGACQPCSDGLCGEQGMPGGADLSSAFSRGSESWQHPALQRKSFQGHERISKKGAFIKDIFLCHCRCSESQRMRYLFCSLALMVRKQSLIACRTYSKPWLKNLPCRAVLLEM